MDNNASNANTSVLRLMEAEIVGNKYELEVDFKAFLHRDLSTGVKANSVN